MTLFDATDNAMTPTPNQSGDTIHIITEVGHARKSKPSGKALIRAPARRSSRVHLVPTWANRRCSPSSPSWQCG